MKATVVLTIGVVALMAALGSAQAQVAAAGKAQAPDAKQIEKGMAVYAAQKCSMCHSIEGKGQAKGPLDGVGTKLKADEIREWVLHPADMTKKTKAERKPTMRAYPNLPKEDLDALVAYLASLKKK
jgi:mono/diheme cytochrome c family protein